MSKKIIVIGAGASGLTAAIMAARKGGSVTVLEQNDRPGKKIAATGNGRCNMTNLSKPRDAYRGRDPEFAKEALRAFSIQDTIRFFSDLGIYTVNKNGWIYPHSGQASSVTEVLLLEAKRLGVQIKTREKAVSIKKEGAFWQVMTQGWRYQGDAVILAGGSKASAIAGSDGSCYELAKSLGHDLVPVLPALTGLKCGKGPYESWSGVRTEGEITLFINQVPLKKAQGELQLTEYGISGIPAFQLSRYAIRALSEGCQVSLAVDFLPEFSLEGLRSFLSMRRQKSPQKNDRQMLVGLFPDRLAKTLLKEPDLAMAIKAYPLTVKSGLSFEKAQVCQGGVDTGQVDSCTMESKLHPGIYFAGELLDIDGACGGYNLQWAWSSGACAGENAAKKEEAR